MLTLLTYTFLIYVSAQSFLQMVNHEASEIKNYEFEMSRAQVQEVRKNMLENSLDMAIGFFDIGNGEAAAPDPSYVSIQALMRSATFGSGVLEEALQLEQCSDNAYLDFVAESEKVYVER